MTTYYETVSTYVGSLSWSDSSLVDHITRDDTVEVDNDTGADLYYWDGANCPPVNVRLEDDDSHTVPQLATTYKRSYATNMCSSSGGVGEITLTMTGSGGGGSGGG